MPAVVLAALWPVAGASRALRAQEPTEAAVRPAPTPAPAVPPGAARPGPEHAELAKAEGLWTVTIEAPGNPPVVGRAQLTMAMRGFWLVEHLVCERDGAPFEGRGTTGFDPHTGRYVTTWIDSAQPTLLVTTGTFDPATRTLTMVGDGVDRDGNPVRVRTRTIHRSADEVVFERLHAPRRAGNAAGRAGPAGTATAGSETPGKETRVLTVTYRRAEAPPGERPARAPAPPDPHKE